jgi:hypothetical protein
MAYLKVLFQYLLQRQKKTVKIISQDSQYASSDINEWNKLRVTNLFIVICYLVLYERWING